MTAPMTRQDAKDLAAKILLSSEGITFRSLCTRLIEANGDRPQVSDGGDMDRIADAVIQRLRKQGRIEFVRKGRDIIWLGVSQ